MSDAGQHHYEMQRISVLVTTYNGERFIAQQLESIRTQSLSVSQVLVCDDGSTDATVDIVRDFIQNNSLLGWEVKVNEVNLGSARNVLSHLGELEGDAVFLADQDDIWNVNKVQVMARYLASNPDLVLVVSRTSTVNEQAEPDHDGRLTRRVNSGSRIYRGSRTEAERLNFEDFVGYSKVPLHAMCVRGSIVRKISAAGKFPELNKSLGPDWYIGMWAATLGECLLIPDILVYRRVHDANISLGGLRKKKVLSVSAEGRLVMLGEAEQAHRAIISSREVYENLGEEERRTTHRMADFISARAGFTREPSALKAAVLLSKFDLYLKSAGTVRHAARMWISDVMYAYNINWNVKKRSWHG